MKVSQIAKESVKQDRLTAAQKILMKTQTSQAFLFFTVQIVSRILHMSTTLVDKILRTPQEKSSFFEVRKSRTSLRVISGLMSISILTSEGATCGCFKAT